MLLKWQLVERLIVMAWGECVLSVVMQGVVTLPGSVSMIMLVVVLVIVLGLGVTQCRLLVQFGIRLVSGRLVCLCE